MKKRNDDENQFTGRTIWMQHIKKMKVPGKKNR